MGELPNPGSVAAIDKGCTCPVMDNGQGRGVTIGGQTYFWRSEFCPLHGTEPQPTHEGGEP